MTSPPKHQSERLASLLNLGSLSLNASRHRWRVMVLGHQSVGKSAFVVRYLTRRFIGDYDPKLERCYPVNTVINGDHVLLELLDSGGHHLEDGSQAELEDKIRWADAFILMYSVTDKCSFDECCRLKFLISYNKRKRRHLFGSPFGNGHHASESVPASPPGVSVILVANKADQVEDRMVSHEEGEKRSRDLGCDLFREISVREEFDVAKRVVEDLYFRWKHQHHNQTPVTLAAGIDAGLLSHIHSQPFFSRRCLDTFAGRHSKDKSGSMDVITEREDNQPASLSLDSPVTNDSHAQRSPPEGFRLRASTEGSLSLRTKRPTAMQKNRSQAQSEQPPTAEKATNNAKLPSRRMSISLRGTNSVM